MGAVLFGASDDLIEFDGDIYDEVPYRTDEWVSVAFSNGFLAKIKYDGEWNIRIVHHGGIPFELQKANTGTVDEIKYADYTDVLKVDGLIEWVVVGEAAVRK